MATVMSSMPTEIDCRRPHRLFRQFAQDSPRVIWIGFSGELAEEQKRSQVLRVPLKSPLKELWRSRPSDVISRNSTSAVKDGSTHVALGFLIGLVSLDFGLTTGSSCFLI